MVADGIALDDQLCFPLYAATRLMTRTYATVLAGEGLTYPQYLVMLVLAEHGPLTMRELGDRLRLDSGTLTPLLKRLERADVVRRHRDPEDERRVVVERTEAGRALSTRLADVPAAVRRACGLEDHEVTALKAQLDGLIRSLDSHLAEPR